MSGRRAQTASAPPRAATMNELPPLSFLIQALLWRLIDLALTPFRIAYALALGFLGATGPPAFHTMLLLSLVPLIAVWSLGAGLVVRSWIPTGWKQIVYLQYGTGRTPWADVALPALSSGQAYDITLELVMPLHAKNSDLGNFMTTLTILNPLNTTLSSSSRPTLIFPHPLSSFFPLSPLIYSGAIPTHRVLIPLIERFSASSYLSSLRAHIEVGREDAWTSLGRGEGKELVLEQAFIKGIPKLSGLRGFFMNHSILLLILTSASFFLATSLCALLAYLVFAPRIRFSPNPLVEGPKYGDIGTSQAWAVKDEGEGLMMIKEEEEEESVSGTETETVGSNRVGMRMIQGQSSVGTSTSTGSESFVTGEDEEDDLTETGELDGSGSEGEVVDLGSSIRRA